MKKLSLNEFVLGGIKEGDTATVDALELHNLVIKYKLQDAKIESLLMEYERINENNKMMCESNIELQAQVAILESKLENKKIVSLGDIFDERG